VAKRDDLHGALCTLRALGPDDLGALEKLCQAADVRRALHLQTPPTLDNLRELVLTKNKLNLWKIVPQGQAKPVGLAGYRVKCGYPFVFVRFDAGRIDIDLTQDFVLVLMHDYFKAVRVRLSEVFLSDPFMVVLPAATAEEMHGFFVDNGFDPMTDHWAVDNKEELAYAILPETYQAYYGEGVTRGDDDGESETEGDDDGEQ